MSSAQSTIQFNNVSFKYSTQPILSKVSFNLEAGGIYGIIGESGSGKTTCLRLINGLLMPTEGEVFFENQAFPYNQAIEMRRSMGYVIQGSGLFPHMTAYENMSFIARRIGWKSEQIKQRVDELVEMTYLSKDLLHKKPRQLSGGQKQRVGIARALFVKPKVMLLDEPFGALDPITRSELQELFIKLQDQSAITAVIVTHSLDEAFKLCDKVLLLNEGRLEQMGVPNELLLKPKTDFVKKFLKTHSPSHVLENIPMYSMINRNIWMTQRHYGKYLMHKKLSRLENQCDNLVQLIEFHKHFKQKNVFYVNAEDQFEGLAQVTQHGHEELSVPVLKEHDHFLTALRGMLNNHIDVLPVVNQDNKLIGCFSQESIDALS